MVEALPPPRRLLAFRPGLKTAAWTIDNTLERLDDHLVDRLMEVTPTPLQKRSRLGSPNRRSINPKSGNPNQTSDLMEGSDSSPKKDVDPNLVWGTGLPGR